MYKRRPPWNLSTATPEILFTASVHCALLLRRFGCERKARLGGHAIQQPPSHVFAYGRPMLKAMPRAASNQPHIFKLRVPVNQEIAVGCVFVLAHSRLNDRRITQRGEAARHVAAGHFRHIRHAVELIVLEKPRRERRRCEARVSRGHAEKEHFLARWKNAFTE